VTDVKRAPSVSGPTQEEVETIARFVDRAARLVVLGGAGCSTESGIPDYRSPDGAYKKRKPMMYQVFVKSAAARRRYWSRSMVGWPRFCLAAPNGTHTSLARLEAAGRINCLITQNVDRLHQAAGSVNVVELHGTNHQVVCIDCGVGDTRTNYQRRLEGLNPLWSPDVGVALAPDGDAELEGKGLEDFNVPPCEVCGGRVKPDVVFFGESVPKDRVEVCFDAVAKADALLVVGSSLTVWSGYRFVRAAARQKTPIAAVTIGPTRGDAEIALKVERRLGEVLPKVLTQLGVT